MNAHDVWEQLPTYLKNYEVSRDLGEKAHYSPDIPCVKPNLKIGYDPRFWEDLKDNTMTQRFQQQLKERMNHTLVEFNF